MAIKVMAAKKLAYISSHEQDLLENLYGDVNCVRFVHHFDLKVHGHYTCLVTAFSGPPIINYARWFQYRPDDTWQQKLEMRIIIALRCVMTLEKIHKKGVVHGGRSALSSMGS